MNSLAYGTQDPATVTAKVSELVTVGGQSAPPPELQQGHAAPTSLGTVVGEGLSLLLGGQAPTTLFTLHYRLPVPRGATLSVPIDRQGIGCHAGGATYAAPIAKPIAGETVLGKPGIFSGAKFEGAAADKLNANAALLKQLKGWVRTEVNIGGVDLTIARVFKVVPAQGGAMVIANNLPKSMKLGLAMSFELDVFAAIVAAIEATL